MRLFHIPGFKCLATFQGDHTFQAGHRLILEMGCNPERLVVLFVPPSLKCGLIRSIT